MSELFRTSLFAGTIACSSACGAAATPAAQPSAVDGMTEARSVELSHPSDQERGREVHVLLDEPVLKLLSITLRRGTLLPEHVIPAPVFIQVVRGTGVVVANGERITLTPESAVLLAPHTPHVVEPTGQEDLELLVQQHLGSD